MFGARDPVNGNDRDGTSAELVTEWEGLKCEWPNANKSKVARWAQGCPARMAIGGVGGGHFLGILPAPAQWPAWADMVDDHRNVRGPTIEAARTHVAARAAR